MKILELHAFCKTLETRILSIENEIKNHHDFKYATNSKIDLLVNKQNHTTEAIEKLTDIVEKSMEKVSQIINIKFMIIGAIGGISAIGTIIWIVLKLYLESLHDRF